MRGLLICYIPEAMEESPYPVIGMVRVSAEKVVFGRTITGKKQRRKALAVEKITQEPQKWEPALFFKIFQFYLRLFYSAVKLRRCCYIMDCLLVDIIVIACNATYMIE